MAINLKKGDVASVSLSKVCAGLGWDPSTVPGVDFDLDASAFLIGANGKLVNDSFFVFYNNPKSPDGAVESSGDDRTGGNSADGDDETLTMDLAKLDSRVQEIVIVVSIYEHKERKQNFGQVHNAYIRIYDANTQNEILRYDLEEDYSVESAVEFGRLYRKGGSWEFEALGLASKNGLEGLVNKYQ